MHRSCASSVLSYTSQRMKKGSYASSRTMPVGSYPMAFFSLKYHIRQLSTRRAASSTSNSTFPSRCLFVACPCSVVRSVLSLLELVASFTDEIYRMYKRYSQTARHWSKLYVKMQEPLNRFTFAASRYRY